MGDRKDYVLLAVVVLLVALSLIPTRERKSATGGADGPEVATRTATGEPSTSSTAAAPTRSRGVAAPLEGVDHVLWPLIEGTVWTYRIMGPKELIPGDSLTMRLTKAPTANEPGTIALEMGPSRRTGRIWLTDGQVRTDALPFFAPVPYVDNVAEDVMGMLLPPLGALVQGAAYEMSLARSVLYRFRDRANKEVEEQVQARETHRVTIVESGTVVVAAGSFPGMRLSMVSRFAVTAGKRPVLDELTSEPYREETMWLARGIGPVRRKIEYRGFSSGTILLDLDSFQVPRR